MRVYLPATLALLRSWAAAGAVGPAPLTGYAVTPGLREHYVDGTDEELEYAASGRAARASLRLLTVSVGVPRRLVIAVDVDDAQVERRDDLDEGAVHVRQPIAWRAVAAGLIDDPAAEPDVAAAVSVIDAADLGDDDAEFTVGATEAHELLWYAAQELRAL